MKTQYNGETLRISDVVEINATNAADFREYVCAAMLDTLREVEIDLSLTRFVDSSGLGALFAIYNAANEGRKRVTLRLVNPKTEVRQLFGHSQIPQLYDIVRR